MTKTRAPSNTSLDEAGADEGGGAAHRVYQGIMADLERRRLVPGQRLVESDLAAHFKVGRNAVREAMQRLAMRGVVDLSRNKSPAIRILTLNEAMDVLEVAGVMMGLMARVAARKFDPSRHGADLMAAMAAFTDAAVEEPAFFSRARRQFYRTLLAIGGNDELERLFPAIAMHILYSQFSSAHLRQVRIADYRTIGAAVMAGDARAAEAAALAHVKHIGKLIIEMAKTEEIA